MRTILPSNSPIKRKRWFKRMHEKEERKENKEGSEVEEREEKGKEEQERRFDNKVAKEFVREGG